MAKFLVKQTFVTSGPLSMPMKPGSIIDLPPDTPTGTALERIEDDAEVTALNRASATIAHGDVVEE